MVGLQSPTPQRCIFTCDQCNRNTFYTGAEVQSKTIQNRDTGCMTNVVMHNAKFQHPLYTVSSNSNSTIVMWENKAGFVSKHNAIPFCFACPPHIEPFPSQTPAVSVKSKRIDARLVDIPLCCKRHRIVRVDR
ncbi:hypothetical protein TNCV_7951 [Trichonephila clavipes]|nr:hypothetical protein TNCV_7951 [Trichonephila clavipes]